MDWGVIYMFAVVDEVNLMRSRLPGSTMFRSRHSDRAIPPSCLIDQMVVGINGGNTLH